MADTELALKKLRAEIESGKKAIKLAIENPLAASFADGLIIGALEGPSARLLRLAQKQKKLGEKEMELELEQEKKRVQSVVREFEELHPPVFESCIMSHLPGRHQDSLNGGSMYDVLMLRGLAVHSMCEEKCFPQKNRDVSVV